VARASTLLILALLLAPAPARAATQTFDAVAPIVRVNVRSGDVTIRTWDRETVSVDADPSLEVFSRTARQGVLLSSIPIPQAAQPSAQGEVTLPPESFVTGDIPPGPREAIVVRDPLGSTPFGPTPVTIMVPSDSAFVFAHTGNGTLDVHDYRSGTFVGFVGSGRMQLDDVGGTVFAQTGRAPMIVTNSSFDRLRARSLFGNMTFERCNVRQIEATSIDGSIVYDGGSFNPGLAHFESTRGDVAIGANGPVQLGGHTAGGGRVYTNFARPAEVDGRDGEATATVQGGGPVVTATSAEGNVFFYDGSLRSRQFSSEWQAPLGALQRPGATVRREQSAPTNFAQPIYHERYPQEYRMRAPPPPRARPNPYPMRRRFRSFRAYRP
jgi:predicted NUDIX family NTP pyrophosphohydrolase